MRCAIYMRVSTLHQSTDAQRTLLMPYAERMGWDVAVYEDLGISGAKDKRPALNRLMGDVAKGLIDVVLVYRFDRFARSTKHLAIALEEFRARKVNFISISENIDTSTPMGTLLFTMISAISQLEREIIRERVQAGVNAAKAKGKVLGRPRVYDKAMETKVKALRLQGQSYGKIALLLSISKNTAVKLAKR